MDRRGFIALTSIAATGFGFAPNVFLSESSIAIERDSGYGMIRHGNWPNTGQLSINEGIVCLPCIRFYANGCNVSSSDLLHFGYELMGSKYLFNYTNKLLHFYQSNENQTKEFFGNDVVQFDTSNGYSFEVHFNASTVPTASDQLVHSILFNGQSEQISSELYRSNGGVHHPIETNSVTVLISGLT